MQQILWYSIDGTKQSMCTGLTWESAPQCRKPNWEGDEGMFYWAAVRKEQDQPHQDMDLRREPRFCWKFCWTTLTDSSNGPLWQIIPKHCVLWFEVLSWQLPRETCLGSIAQRLPYRENLFRVPILQSMRSGIDIISGHQSFAEE